MRDNKDRNKAARSGLYDTAWPLEHADKWRTQSTTKAGLPADFDANRLRVQTLEFDQPIVGYTRDKNEVFILGGMPYAMNEYTQAIIEGTTKSPTTLEELISNLPHTPYAAKIDPVTLRFSVLPLTHGHTVNYPGGMLMHANGFIYAIAQAVLYKIDPAAFRIVDHVQLPQVGSGIEAFLTIYNGMQVISTGQIVTKCFVGHQNPKQGWLLLIDPETLHFDAAQLVGIQSARLSVDEPEPGTAYVYAPTLSESRRFRIVEEGFLLDRDWTAEYRQPETTWANGTLFMKTHLVFPDNSAPGPTTPMHIYFHPIEKPPRVLEPQRSVSESEAGVNFWKVMGDPYSNDEHGLIVTFVPVNKKIAAYRLYRDGRAELLWERAYLVSASPAMVPDRDLLYINDFDGTHDHFVVARLSTGEELARRELPATEPTMGIIFPGLNDDAYLLSTETGGKIGFFNRLYLE
jgi:hypothetical protein